MRKKLALMLISLLVPILQPARPVKAAGAGEIIVSQVSDADLTADWNVMKERLDEAVRNGKGENVHLVAGDTFTIPEDILSRLAGKNATLALYTNCGVTFTVSGVDVKKSDTPISMTLSFEPFLSDEALQQLHGAQIVKQFQTKTAESYPCLINAHLALGAENAGKNAVLYSYDESGRLKQEAVYRINEAGSAMFGLSRGGSYVVTVMDSYIVMPGDVLSRIAVKQGISLQELAAANPQVTDLDRIRVGQILNIPDV